MEQYYKRTAITGRLSRFARSFYLATSDVGELTITGPPTGYPLLGYIWRGIVDVSVDGRNFPIGSLPINMFCGQLEKVQAHVGWSGKMGHAVIEFTATGLYELFGFPGDKLVNAALPGAVVDADFDADMTERFSSVTNAEGLFEAYETLLTQKSDNAQHAPDYISQAIELIETASGAVKMSDVLAQVGTEEHIFNHEFKHIVGLSPKYFCRILQFNSVAEIILTGDAESLAQIAAEAGYYDQSHFTKAFHEFVLTSPRRFLDGNYAHISTFLRNIDAR